MFEKALSVFGALIVVPLSILNVVGGTVAGIWLIALGEWRVFGWGLLAFAVSTFGISLAFLPAMLLAAPAAYFAERENVVAVSFLALLASIYMTGVVMAWCLFVLFYFSGNARTSALVPTLMWSYGVATGPFAWMASKERTSEYSASLTTTLFAQIGYVAAVLLVLLGHPTRLTVVGVFSVAMAISIVANVSVAIAQHRATRRVTRRQAD
jgi:hypothetical protein